MDQVIVRSGEKINHGRFHDKYRGSQFRGISRNGKSWQVLIMIDSEKIYLCSNNDPYKAANLYDLAVVQAKGLGAKPNFPWTKA